MDPNDVQKIVEYLKELASPAVEKGYEIVYRQVVFGRVVDITVIILLSALLFWLLYRLKWIVRRKDELQDRGYEHRTHEEDREYERLNEFSLPALVLGYLLVPVLIFPIAASIFAIVNFIMNPNWMVIQLILSQVK